MSLVPDYSSSDNDDLSDSLENKLPAKKPKLTPASEMLSSKPKSSSQASVSVKTTSDSQVFAPPQLKRPNVVTEDSTYVIVLFSLTLFSAWNVAKTKKS